MFYECSHNRRPESSPNALDPARMSAVERLDEVAEILAAGLLRFRARQSKRKSNKSNGLREVPLDFPPERSVCGHEPNHDREGR